jgi:hypothetical protein
MNAATRFASAIAGREPASSYLEVRHLQPDGERWAQRFFQVEDHARAADFALRAGAALDCYMSGAPRVRRRGRSADVERAWMLSADCDTAAAIRSLEHFDPQPAIVIASGGLTREGRPKVHGHWPLNQAVGREAIKVAKSKLAHALGSDLAVTDAARVWRCPGTLNHKGEPRPVECITFTKQTFTVAEVIGDLPEPEPDAIAERIISPDDWLRNLPPRRYIADLTKIKIGHERKINCPLVDHDDERPSFAIYESAARGWHCFGCRRGGDVFSFAALFGGHVTAAPGEQVKLTGSRFLEVQDALLDFYAGRLGVR